jgi:hypothetical protein
VPNCEIKSLRANYVTNSPRRRSRVSAEIAASSERRIAAHPLDRLLIRGKQRSIPNSVGCMELVASL